MAQIAFATYLDSNKFDKSVALFASSLRKFGGALAESPVFVLHPERVLHHELDHFLSTLDVETIPIDIPKNFPEFPFAKFTYAAASAEALLEDEVENLAWIGSNTLILKEPEEFILTEGINLGYRPVHHTLIGSLFEEAVDPFWELLYKKFSLNEEKIFPMKTHIDNNTLRAYFNAGCIVVHPKRNVLENWWEYFQKVIRNKEFSDFLSKDLKYNVFLHQAVLSILILKKFNRDSLKELPFTYNYPLHLYNEASNANKPESLNNLVTARFENIETKNPFESIPLSTSIQDWINTQLDIYSKMHI